MTGRYWVLPVGTALAGGLADAFGVRGVMLGMAGVTVATAAFVALVYRPILSIDLDARGQITVGGRPVTAGIAGPHS